jgi:hypothetical protein
VKWAQVEQHSKMASAADPPSGPEEAILVSLTVGSGHGVPQASRGSEDRSLPRLMCRGLSHGCRRASGVLDFPHSVGLRGKGIVLGF